MGLTETREVGACPGKPSYDIGSCSKETQSLWEEFLHQSITLVMCIAVQYRAGSRMSTPTVSLGLCRKVLWRQDNFPCQTIVQKKKLWYFNGESLFWI